MPTITAREFQHASIDLQLAADGPAVRIKTFNKLSFKDGAGKNPVHDSQGQIIDHTIDKQKTDGNNLSLLLSEWWKIRDQLLQQFGTAPDGTKVGIGNMKLTLTVNFGNTLATLRKRKILDLEFTEDPVDSTDDQQALYANLPFVHRGVLDENDRRFVEYR